jgi:hypothetical protein
MGPFSLMIARFPGNNQEHPAAAGYVMQLMETLHNDDRVGAIVPFRLSDTPITMSRNRCVKQALQHGVDYILMIDSDMSPDCEAGAPPFWQTAWEFMMDRRRAEREHPDRALEPATIAAPYCGPPPNEQVYIFRWLTHQTGAPDPDFALKMVDRDDATRRTGIEEVAALPTGLILYDTRVFRKLPPPWFDYEWQDEPYRTEKASTEDVFQTRNASIMGLPQFVTWDCWAGHVKLKTVTKPAPLTLRAIRGEFARAVLRHAGK